MKPSFTNEVRKPATDAKFHPTDEHLIAENKEEVAKIHHGDKLENLEHRDTRDTRDTPEAERGRDDDDREAERATAP